MKEGKYDEAIFHYDEALKLEPDYITALQGKATVLCVQGNKQLNLLFRIDLILEYYHINIERKIFRCIGRVQ